MDNKGYRHTLGIHNTYCFYMATAIVQTCLYVMFIHTVPVLNKTGTVCININVKKY